MANMNLRGALSNKIIDLLDTSVNNAMERAVHSFLKKNNAKHGNRYLCFQYKREFYPSKGLTRTQQRDFSIPLDKSLHDDFEEYHKLLVQDYQVFRSKMRHYIARIFRSASSHQELMSMLPNGLHPALEILEFVPLASAKGITDEEREELSDYYAPILNEVHKYLSVKNLI